MSGPEKPRAPAPTPAVDEFAGIPSPPTRHPALAVAAAGLALFLIFHIRADVRYALSSQQPLDLGDARSVLGSRQVALDDAVNRLVRVKGVPDRESALEIDTKGSWVFTQFFRILGTDSRLFVHRPESPLPAARAEQDVFVGRLVRFASLPFEDAIRAHFERHVQATHFFRGSELVRAVAARGGAGAGLTLPALTGDTVALRADDVLAIDVRQPNQYRISFPRDRFRDEAAARVEVEKRGGTVVASPAPQGPSAPVVLRVSFPPEQRDVALGQIGDLDRKVDIREARDTHEARVGGLRMRGDTLVITGQGEISIPAASIAAVKLMSTVKIPADAYLLVEGDTPRAHLHSVFVALVLLAFGVFNIAGLVRALRAAAQIRAAAAAPRPNRKDE